jgi:hypothetical protein
MSQKSVKAATEGGLHPHAIYAAGIPLSRDAVTWRPHQWWAMRSIVTRRCNRRRGHAPSAGATTDPDRPRACIGVAATSRDEDRHRARSHTTVHNARE